MNGNELNNMAQRYKEEMMRLYRKSGTAQSGMTGSASRNMEGTPISEGAQYFDGRQEARKYSHSAPSATQSGTVPVNCDCRFPSAESIIDSIASTPSTLPLYPDKEKPSNSHVQPRSAVSQNTDGSEAELHSIMLNNAPEKGVYVMPSDTDAEKELFPDFDLPADAEADSARSIPFIAGFLPSAGWIDLTGDNSWGYLQFEVFTAGGSYPVPGAVITVKKQLAGGTGLTRVLVSNRSGLTSTIALPAPAPAFSLRPNSANRPFSEYTVTVRARGYYTLTDINIPMFAGVKTVQPIDLIPLPEHSVSTPIQPRSDSQGTVG